MAGTLIGLDDDRDVFLQCEALDDGRDAADADVTPAVDDFIVGGDSDEDTVLLELDGGSRLGFVHLHAGLLDEDGGDDKENQKDEDHIDHRREIDLYVVAVVGC